MKRTASVFICMSALLVGACGGGGPSAASAMKDTKANDAKAKATKAAKAEEDVKKGAALAAAKRPPPGSEYPWTFESLRDGLALGTKLTYKRTGTNTKGKKVNQTIFFEVKRHRDDVVGTTMVIEGGGDKQPGSMLAESKWTKYSPFFKAENPEHKVVKTESVTVPAGTFEAVVTDINGFFGSRRTVWLIPDKPGIYAKIHEKKNAGDEKDKTDLVYELVSIENSQVAAAGG